MLINGKDASLYSAKLIDRSISTTVVNSLTDWVATAVEGELLHQQYDFKSIRLTFLVTQTNEDAAYKQISALTESLKKCTLRFDDISLDFTCYLDGKAEPIRLQNGVFKVVYLLKNDWGNGELQHVTFDVDTEQTRVVEVKYVQNWLPTINFYAECFSDDEINQVLHQEQVIVGEQMIADLFAGTPPTTWDDVALGCGIDLDAYRPGPNAQRGHVRSEAEVSANFHSLTIVYDRFSKDGYADMPDANYPSIVQTTGRQNNYGINLGIGQGVNVQDLSVIATGRWFESDGGVMIGAGEEKFFSSYFDNPKAYFNLSNTPKIYSFKVVNADTTKGKNVVIQTLESIEQLPLRTYGFRSSNRGKAPNKGYIDLIFNGTTLDRVPVDEQILTDNLTLFAGYTDQQSSTKASGTWCDIARVQVYIKDDLVLDAIPIASSVKNGFINRYDVGWYDMINMKYLPWFAIDGSLVNPNIPPEILPLDGGDAPEPPEPPAPPTPVYPEEIYVYEAASHAEGDLAGNNQAFIMTSYVSMSTNSKKTYTFVWAQPGVTGTWSWYNSSYFTGTSGYLSDGRAYCTLRVTKTGNVNGQYIRFTGSDVSGEKSIRISQY